MHLEVVVHVARVPDAHVEDIGWEVGHRTRQLPAVSTLPTADSSDELNSRCCSMLRAVRILASLIQTASQVPEALRVGWGLAEE